MAQNYAASVTGVAIRATRLNANGSTVTGASASYVLNKFSRVSFTPEYEEGDEFTEKTAGGEVCVTYKSPDTLKRVNLEVAICDPDPEFTELIAGGVLLSAGGNSVGYAAAVTGADALPNGASLEVWSRAISGGMVAPTNPYFRWVFPYVQLRPTGERVIENGVMANVFEGFGLGNATWGDGPQNDWTFSAYTDRAYAYARVATAPTGLNGYQATI